MLSEPNDRKNRASDLINGMSVDVEDYFQTEAMAKQAPRGTWDQIPSRVERNTERLFELFAKHKVRATFFFLGWVAERYPKLVRQAVETGHEIGCHSYAHRPLYSLSPEEFREDTRRAKAVIEDIAGVPTLGYRAPSFSMTPGTPWAAQILAECGFLYDSSVHPVVHDFYKNQNAPRYPHRISGDALLEIPISTLRVGSKNLPFSGGGYFRIFPYSYTRWAIRRMNRVEHQPTTFYLHPWEIDPEQPRFAASGRSRFRQYTGLAKTWVRLERLLNEFSFAPYSEVFSENRVNPAGINGSLCTWAKPGKS